VNGDGFVNIVAQMKDTDGAFTDGQTSATITPTLNRTTSWIQPLSGTAPIYIVP